MRSIAILEGDRVTGLMSGLGMDGVEVPAELSELPPDRMRWNGKELIDAATVLIWYVDSSGTRWLKSGGGRRKVECAWDAPLVKGDDGRWAVAGERQRLSPLIRAEFDRRITLALDNKQASMLREAVYLQTLAARGEELTAAQLADVAMFEAINAWESAMIDVREDLVARAEKAFADDEHWPAAPEGLTAFLKGY